MWLYAPWCSHRTKLLSHAILDSVKAMILGFQLIHFMLKESCIEGNFWSQVAQFKNTVFFVVFLCSILRNNLGVFFFFDPLVQTQFQALYEGTKLVNFLDFLLCICSPCRLLLLPCLDCIQKPYHNDSWYDLVPYKPSLIIFCLFLLLMQILIIFFQRNNSPHPSALKLVHLS